MKLEYSEKVMSSNATESDIRKAFAGGRDWDPGIILSRSDTVFIQSADQGEGRCTLEYRDGDDSPLFEAVPDPTKSEVESAFLKYLKGDATWKTDFKWEDTGILDEPTDLGPEVKLDGVDLTGEDLLRELNRRERIQRIKQGFGALMFLVLPVLFGVLIVRDALGTPSNLTMFPFLVFLPPFAMFGAVKLFAAITGRDPLAMRQIGSMRVAGSVGVVVFVLSSAFCAFGLAFGGAGLSAPVKVTLSLVALVLCPLVSLLANRWAGTSKDAGEGEPPPMSKEARTRVLALGSISVIWCAVIGAVLVINFGALPRQWDAQLRFAATPARVISSRVVVKPSGTKGHDYLPSVKYAYSVDGANFTGDQLDFLQWRDSNRSYSQATIARYPAGAQVMAYYDPRDPSVAILEPAPKPSIYFFLYCLHIFAVAGVLMVAAVVATPFTDRRRWRFMHEPAEPPWKIPTWGTLRSEGEALVLPIRRRLAGGVFFIVYFVATVLGIFGLAMIGPNGLPSADIGFLWLSVIALALGAALLGRFSAKAELRIAPHARTVSLTSRKRNWELRFDEIEQWQIVTIVNPRILNGGGGRWSPGPLFPTVPMLQIVTTTGEHRSVHVFGYDDQMDKIARKVAETFGELTGKPAEVIKEVDKISSYAGMLGPWRRSREFTDIMSV